MKLKYWLYIIWLSAKWIFRQNLGDQVVYSGKKYLIANGVVSNCWRLSGLQNDNDGWVKRNECRKIITPYNLLHSFRSGYRFYMGYWFNIWVRNGIEEWVKRLPIW